MTAGSSLHQASAPPHVVALRCTRCGALYAPETVDTVCPQHGDEGILDVVYDYASLARSLDPGDVATHGEFSMWRYRALLPVSPTATVPPLHVGGTPLYHVPRLGAQLGLPNLFVKDDGRNPTASLKDRASALVLVKAQERHAAIVTTASTGNAAAALAGLAASSGQTTVIFVPKTAPPAKVAQLLTYGATVLLVDGNYDAAFDLCLAASREFGWYCRNTGYNPYTVEGKKTVAYEICAQLGARRGDAPFCAPDVIVVSVGDGNIITGVHRGLQDLLALGWIDTMPRLVAVQSSGSAAIYNAWAAGHDTITPVAAHTIADSIAADLPRDGLRALRALRETHGTAVQVDDAEILAAMPRLARGSGVFAEPAGAAPLAGLQQLLDHPHIPARGQLPKHVAQGTIDHDATVVLLVTGNGLKDIQSAMRASGTAPIIEPSLAAVKRVLQL